MKRYIILLIVTSLIVASCSLIFPPSGTDYFAAYRGTNLIAHQQFDSTDWNTTIGAPYFTFEAVNNSTISTAGLPDWYEAGNMYRLEVKNLITDGTFEDFSAGSVDNNFTWTITDGNNTMEILDGNHTNAIDGKTLHIVLVRDRERADYDLSQLLDSAGAVSNYGIKFDYKTPTQFFFSYHVGENNQSKMVQWRSVGPGPNGSLEDSINTIPRGFPPSTSMPQSFFPVENEANHYLSVGTLVTELAPPQEVYIDNIRIFRRYNYRLSLDLNVTDANRLKLLDGTYKFSFFAQKDPVAVENRYKSTKVLIEIMLLGENVNERIKTEVFDITDDWTQISLTKDNLQFSNVQYLEDAVLRLSVSPVDTSNVYNTDVGSLLIASPKLEFLPSDTVQ